jgi:allantoicase
MVKRSTCWALTGVIRLTWALARGATKLDDAGLWLDGWANRVAVRQGIDMLDVLSPLNQRLPVAGEG